MKLDQAEKLAVEHLLPMFPGSTLRRSDSTSRDGRISWVGGGQQVAFKLDSSWKKRLLISRSQSFSLDERRLIGAFVNACDKVDSAMGKAYEADVLRSLGRIVVTASIFFAHGDTLGDALATLEHWAVQTYEGQAVTAGLGILPNASRGENAAGITFDDFRRLDIAKVLGDGADTLVVFDANGIMRGLESLGANGTAPAPLHFSGACTWAKFRRIALCLNRRGEILLFTGGGLRFARRRGSWIFFDMKSTIRRWNIHSTALRASVYDSCLDVSFARTGACIALVTMANARTATQFVAEQDLLDSSGGNPKIAALRKIIAGRLFQDLSRPVRQELLALDGAVVLAHTGAILAAGAIVRVPGGSTGGGRRAAAAQLSKLGVGIKISADGGLTAFADRKVIYEGF